MAERSDQDVQNEGRNNAPSPWSHRENVRNGVPSENTPLLPSNSTGRRGRELLPDSGSLSEARLLSTVAVLRPLSSVKKTFSNIVISIFGAGVLGMPYAFKQSGWLCGSLALMFVGFTCYHNMMLLVVSKKKVESGGIDGIESYSELGYVTYGKLGEIAVDLMVVLSQAGFCVAYLIFIGENLASVFASEDSAGNSKSNKRDLDQGFGGVDWQAKAIYIWIVFPFQIWLASIRSLARLAPFSIFADVANFVAMIVVIQKDVLQLHQKGIPSKIRSYTGWDSIPFAVGIAVYAYEGFGLVLPIESNMKDRSKFRKTLGTALGAITVLFTVFSFLGYFAFGDSTKDIITLNLGTSWQTSIIKSGLCFGLFFTFPVMMVPVHEVVERRFKDGRTSILLRFATVLSVSWTAVGVPHFGDFLSLIGCSVCCMLFFVFPGLFHLKTHQGDLGWWQVVTDYASVSFGVIFGIWGTWLALKRWG